ncbi:hypothetical protein [Pseudorhodoplanes sp.]|uniref:hypothetical protein n=1 Tax=Pseudorhodoplanes sp. TaxID=1934341 RepID=UPI002B867E09|nr:hypothetical protein [Pseudorhodoplanes sp.]HWV54359.1 hypothetical protein [Pseudorhodoplanes sp.]
MESGIAMEKLSRRALLRTLAGGAATTVGTVVIARTALASIPDAPVEGALPADIDVQARAAELEAADVVGPAGQAHAQFVNLPGVGGFGNGGGFRNGGFLNAPFGNGGFRNGFRNGGFGNGGGFRNGGFRNGGGGHGGFRNAFRNH